MHAVGLRAIWLVILVYKTFNLLSFVKNVGDSMSY